MISDKITNKAADHVSKFHNYANCIWGIKEARGKSNAVSYWLGACLESALDKHKGQRRGVLMFSIICT